MPTASTTSPRRTSRRSFTTHSRIRLSRTHCANYGTAAWLWVRTGARPWVRIRSAPGDPCAADARLFLRGLRSRQLRGSPVPVRDDEPSRLCPRHGHVVGQGHSGQPGSSGPVRLPVSALHSFVDGGRRGVASVRVPLVPIPKPPHYDPPHYDPPTTTPLTTTPLTTTTRWRWPPRPHPRLVVLSLPRIRTSDGD